MALHAAGMTSTLLHENGLNLGFEEIVVERRRCSSCRLQARNGARGNRSSDKKCQTTRH